MTTAKSLKHYEWVKKNPDKIKPLSYEQRRRAMLKNRYGITMTQYNRLLEARSGKCAACGKLEIPLHVDHDHKTNKIRGLLCKGCNAALGMVRDNPIALCGLINYLNRGFVQ